MSTSAWILSAVNAIAASVMLTAGAAKLVSPGPLLNALSQTFPLWRRSSLTQVLRAFAVAETAVAALFLFGPSRLPAAIGVAVLGTCVAGLGLRGLLVGSTAPCGCFGASSRRPLGWANVAVGVALVAVLPVNAVLKQGADYQAATVLLTVIGSSTVCVYVNRSLVTALLWPGRGVRAESNEVH